MINPNEPRPDHLVVDASRSPCRGAQSALGFLFLSCLVTCPCLAVTRSTSEALSGQAAPKADASAATSREIDVRNYALALNARGDTLLLEEHDHRQRKMGDVEIVRIWVVNRDGAQLAEWRSPLGAMPVQSDAGRLSYGSPTPALLGDDRYVACSIGEAEGWVVWAPDYDAVMVLAGADLQLRDVFPYGHHEAESVALLGAFAQTEGRTIVMSWARIHDQGSRLVFERMEVALGDDPRRTSTSTTHIDTSADDLLGQGSRLVRAVGASGRREGISAVHAHAAGQSNPDRWALVRIDWDARTISGVTTRLDINDVVACSVRGREVALAQRHGSILLGELSPEGTELRPVSQLIVPNAPRSLRLEAHRLLAIPQSRDPILLVVLR